MIKDRKVCRGVGSEGLSPLLKVLSNFGYLSPLPKSIIVSPLIMSLDHHNKRNTLSHDNFFSIYRLPTYFLSNQIFKQYLLVALIFTQGTGNYKKGVIGNSCNF